MKTAKESSENQDTRMISDALKRGLGKERQGVKCKGNVD